jgi:hypothetical protein
LYFYNFDFSQLDSYRINPVLHPVFAIKVFFFSVGNIAGKPLPLRIFPAPSFDHPLLGTANPWIIVFGIIVTVAAVLAVVKTGFRNAKNGAEALGVTLIVFAITFDALTAYGRGLYGYAGVSLSKYATFSLLTVVGIYLVVISRPVSDRVIASTPRPTHRGPTRSIMRSDLQRIFALAVRGLSILAICCVAIGVVSGYSNGLSEGRNDHAVQVNVTNYLRKLQMGKLQLPGSKVALLDPSESARATIKLIHVAERDKLSLFDQG